MDTFRFTLYSDNDDFNIDNPKNIYFLLRENQTFEVYEYIHIYDDDNNLISTDEIFMGIYYLKEWKSSNKYIISFECVDLIGLLDDIKIVFAKNENSMLSIIISILASIDEYFGGYISERYIDIADNISLNDGTLKFAMPFCTCREALQMACFAISASASCSRRKYIYIELKDNLISHDIKDENNFGVLSSTVNPEITGIQYTQDIRLVPKKRDNVYDVSTLIEIENIEIGNNQKIWK